MTKELLADHFKQTFESVCSANIIHDPATKISKGYGFVQFSSKSDAEAAIQSVNGTFFRGKSLKVKESIQRSNNTRIVNNGYNGGGGHRGHHNNNGHNNNGGIRRKLIFSLQQK